MQPRTPEPQNYENYLYEYETSHETYETKSMKLRNLSWKSQNPGHYEKLPWNNSLLMKPMIMKSTKPMKTMRRRNFDNYVIP